MKHGMFISGMCAIVALVFAPQAGAALIHLGYAEGGLGVYFNEDTGLGEDGNTNVAYTRSQRDINTPDRGAYFQFDDTAQAALGGLSFNDVFSGQPVGSSQFGFDSLTIFPTYDTVNNNPAIPSFFFADNLSHPGDPGALPALTDVTPTGPNEFVWAINDYNGPGAGVFNNSSIVRNSLFRGQNGTVSTANLTPTVDGFDLEISGWLQTDGYIHWSDITAATPPDPAAALSTFGVSDWIYFDGTLSYDLATDTSTNLVDFYGGRIDFYLSDSPVIPEPSTALLLGVGIAGLACRRRRS